MLFQKELKGKFLGPSYRKFVRPVIQKYEIRKISNSKLKNIGNDDLNKIKLVGIVKFFNEEKNGNLERCLKHLSVFCDDIVVCNDSSTDNSLEIAKKYTNHIIQMPNDFKNELQHKQKLLDTALSLKPNWIVSLDPDEIFDRVGEMGGIRSLCHYGDKHEIDAYSFLYYNLWKNTENYRIDELWLKNRQPKLWKNTGNLRFEIKSGLHFNLYPLGLKKIRDTDIKLIHYGFASEESVQRKYSTYHSLGQTGKLLERIKDEHTLKLEKFSRDWFPLSTFKITVVCLIYKSVEYLKFILNSFNKYTSNAELIFIANDATDKVKNYLEENSINHLIFENKDKNEHYIKRVYRAWNFGGNNVDGDIIIFVNSDMAFSENWLGNLLKNLNEKRIMTSRLVESGKLESGKTAISKNFGKSYNEFDDDGFQNFVKKIKKNKIIKGGLFMPCAIYKEIFVKSTGYPIGNRTEKSGKIISGDWIYFYEKLKSVGIQHYTVYDSIVYHIQEGEMDD